ncbi:cytochrome P450 4C1-like [Colias croceus]|uniref:cytochrome P450 4C1-like n=1 Tax=Colias crocea TaxID=72248 RepID=UPI001E27F24F|nr:cytochrome P450 4C1-like [Colias croceus]
MNLLLIGAVVVLWYMLYRYRRRRLYKLADRIPAVPADVADFQSFNFVYNLKDTITDQIKNVSYSTQKIGGLSKIWVGPLLYVVATNVNDVEYILKNCLEKANISKFLRYVIGNAGIFAPVSIWTRRRKVLITVFTPKIINSFMDILIKQSEELANQLYEQKAVGNGPFLAWPFVCSYTLDSVCETALGIRINYLRNPNNAFMKATADLMTMTTDRLFRAWLWPDWMYRFSPRSTQFADALKIVYDLTDDIIRKKRKELDNVEINLDNYETVFGQGQKVRCFLEHLIILSKNNTGLNNVELREEVLTLLFAGSDTSSIVICNTLTLLAKYPKVQEKVYEELREVLGDTGRSVTKDDLKEVKYLERVVRESMRLYPPAPLLVRQTTEETKLPSGVTLPADTGVIMPIWGVGRDKEAWGPDADCFNPDRFLPENKTGPFLAFSSGPRNCVGYQYAMMSVKLALIAVLRRYKVIGEQELGPVPNINNQFNLVMKDKDGYPLTMEVR